MDALTELPSTLTKTLPIDFSALSNLICGRMYQFSCVYGLDNSNPGMTFGSAIHRYLELHAKNSDQSILERVYAVRDEYELDETNTAELVVIGAMWEREKHIPALADIDGNLIVEWKFAFPIIELNKYEVVLSGTTDILQSINNSLMFTDYKSTRYMRSKASKVIGNYLSSLQLPFYIYIFGKYLHHFLPHPYNEIAAQFKILGRYKMIYLSDTPPRFEDTSPVYLSLERVTDIEELLTLLIHKAVSIHNHTGIYPAEGTAYKICADCAYNSICAIKDKPRLEDTIAKLPKRIYDPTKFR